MWRHIADLAGPDRCRGCRARGSVLCRRCEVDLASPSPRACPPGIDALAVPWGYAGAARSLVLGLKGGGRRESASPLIRAMVDAARRRGVAGTAVTWVPGTAIDIRRRGFDHAEVLAAGVGAGLGLVVAPVLRRTGGDRIDQTKLGAGARWKNLDQAFAAVARGSERVVLVDDVITTGATAAACARALRGAGAVRVELVAACSA